MDFVPLRYDCPPVAKTKTDRSALIGAVTQKDNNKFFFGSDSAPHHKEHKKLPNPNLGLFVPPQLATSLVWNVFLRRLSEKEQLGEIIRRFDRFMSTNAETSYRLDSSSEKARLIYDPWEVPREWFNVPIFKAGTYQDWKILV